MDFLTSLINSMPGAVAQGLIWGIMAIGVYITYRILDVADLTVDGSLGTGGAVCVVLVLNGVPVGVALLAATLVGMLAGLVTGLFHTACGIPAILAGILTQLALYSVNLRIMGTGTGGGKANLPISVDKYSLLVSARYVRALAANNPIIVLVIFCAILIGVLYWFFGTEMGCFAACHRRKPAYGPRTGHQHECHHCAGADDFQRSGCTVRWPAGAVSGLLGYQYGPRRNRYRSGGGHHRRGYLQQNLPQLRTQAAGGRHWRYHLLHCYELRAAHGSVHR